MELLFVMRQGVTTRAVSVRSIVVNCAIFRIRLHGRSSETRRLHGDLYLGMPGYLCHGHGVLACSSWMRRKNIARLRDTILEKTTKVSILQLNAKTITYLRAVYSSSARYLA